MSKREFHVAAVLVIVVVALVPIVFVHQFTPLYDDDDASANPNIARVFHGVNLMPPSHGLHADQDVTLVSLSNAVEQAKVCLLSLCFG